MFRPRKLLLESLSRRDTFLTFSASSRAVNVYIPGAEVTCLMISAHAAPVADLASTKNGCKATGIVMVDVEAMMAAEIPRTAKRLLH
jgi:hypothetical protein